MGGVGWFGVGVCVGVCVCVGSVGGRCIGDVCGCVIRSHVFTIRGWKIRSSCIVCFRQFFFF